MSLRYISNLDLIVDILEINLDYWLVVDESNVTWFIGIPYDLERAIPRVRITLDHIAICANKEVNTNVCISVDYPPFQYGKRLRDFKDGVVIPDEVKLIDFLSMPRGLTYYDYKSKMQDLQNERLPI